MLRTFSGPNRQIKENSASASAPKVDVLVKEKKRKEKKRKEKRHDIKAPEGFEPSTSCLLDRRSNQLSYGALTTQRGKFIYFNQEANVLSWFSFTVGCYPKTYFFFLLPNKNLSLS